jgi:diguanylate cyclase (GGDEF)-like protein/putative nucleotidyltransferase with HDIG domain
MRPTESIRPRSALLLGAVFVSAAAIEILSLRPADPLRFFTYLAVTLIASVLRLQIPQNSPSFSLVPILLSIADLSNRETIILTGASAMLEFWRTRPEKFDLVRTILRVLDPCVAVFIAWAVFHFPLLQKIGIAPIPRLAMAAAILYVLSSGLLTSLVGWLQGQPVRVPWKQGMFALYVAGAIVAGATSTLGQWIGWQVAMLCVPVTYMLYWACLSLLEGTQARTEYSEYLASLHLQIIELLALAIGARDQTHPRLRRLQFFATELGKQMKLEDADLQALSTASLLHDVGKLAIPEHILNKPGRLSPEEFEKIKIHPVVGAEILEMARLPYPAAEIVSSHHERWDGTGYPNGLSGEEIPLAARILAVVDTFDELSSPRPYRRALTPEAAMAEIAEESGKSYDPRVVSILGEQYRELEQRMNMSEKSKNPDTSIDGATLNRLNSIGDAQKELLELSKMLEDLNYSVSLHEVLPQFAARLKKMLPFDAVVIHGIELGRLKPQFVNGQEFEPLCSLNIPLGGGVAGMAAQLNQPICNADPSTEKEFASEPLSSFSSLLAVPLMGSTCVTGVLSVYRREERAFSAEDLRIGMAVASKLGQCLENAAKFQKLAACATVDFITNLPNSRALFEKLDSEVARCRRSGESLAVLVCDLDGFKAVNDRFGHLQGNMLLQLVGQRLRDSCRTYDYVARMGGDEFVILMPGLEIANLPDRLTSLQNGVKAASRELLQAELVGVSAGCAFFPEDGTDAEALLSRADKRMYLDKNDREWSTPEADPVTMGLVHLSQNNSPQGNGEASAG